MNPTIPRLAAGAPPPPASPRTEDAARPASPETRERLQRPEAVRVRTAVAGAAAPRARSPGRDVGQHAAAEAVPADRGEDHLGIDRRPQQAVPAVGDANNAQQPAEAGPARRALGLLATGLTGLSYAGCAAAGWAMAKDPNDPFPQRVGVAAVLLRLFAFGLEVLAQPGGGDRAAAVGQLRRPELRDPPLDRLVKEFCAPGSPASRFDWTAPRLFVDGDNDMTAAVSRLLARALAVARTPAGADVAPALRRYADSLASSADLRASLALTVVDANAGCEDRLGVTLGGLMLASDMYRVRGPQAAPADVVHTLVLHAATRAMDARMAQLPGLQHGPSAELLLAGYRAVQAALVGQGVAVPEVFPERLFLTLDVWRHQGRVAQFAREIADAATLPAAPGQPAGAGLAELLRRHGGSAGEEILSARLAHLTGKLAGDLLAGDEAEGPDRPDTSGARLGSADEQLRAYNEGVAAIRARAIAGALAGDTADWERPAGDTAVPAAASTSGSGPGPEAHDDYDPVKGKWKVN
jgi:hypothetical protein